jgi:hypothetical protein
MTEPSGNDDPLGRTDGSPCVVVLYGIGDGSFRLEVGGIDPLELQTFSTSHGSVFESFDYGHVRVLEGDVFPYEDDGDGLVSTFSTVFIVPYCFR